MTAHIHDFPGAADLDFPTRGRRKRIFDKIMCRVQIDADGCWIWTGPDSGKAGRGGGYPRMALDGATVAVHIAMWIIFNGPIPPRKQLDHQCRKRRCVRPNVCTELVTHKKNQERRAHAQRKAKEAADAGAVS